MKATDTYFNSSYGFKLIAAEAAKFCGKLKEVSLANENRMVNNLLKNINRPSKKKLIKEIIEHVNLKTINDRSFTRHYKSKYYTNPVIVPKEIELAVAKKLKQVRKIVRFHDELRKD